MKIRLPRRPQPEDALVADAVPAKAVDHALIREEALASWKDFPGPNAKRKTCAHCGGFFIRPCFDHEHVGCLHNECPGDFD